MKYTKKLTEKFLYLFGGMLVFSAILSNGLNFLYNAYLGRALNLETFGIISLIGGILSIADIPFSSLSRTVTYKSAYVLGRYQRNVNNFWLYVRKRAIVLSIIITLLWIILIPFMNTFFDTDGYMPLILITPVWIIGLILAVDSGYLTGNLKFAFIAVMTVVEALTKLLFAYIFVQFGYQHYVYAAIPLSMLSSLLVALFAVKQLKHTSLQKLHASVLTFPKSFFATSVFMKVSSVAYLSLDVIFAKHFLSPVQAGEYALLSLSGKIIFFAGSLFSQFILPLVSKKEGEGESSQTLFYKLLLATAAVCFVSFVVIGVFGSITIPLLFGNRAKTIITFLSTYTLAMVFFTLSNSIVSYYQLKKQNIFPLTSFLIAILQVLGIILFHKDVQTIATVMVVIGLFSFASTFLLHIFNHQVRFLIKNIVDFFGLFTQIPEVTPTNPNGLRILIFNWRDTKHVWAGGAEIYIHELAKHWAKNGSSVTLFCGNDGKHPRYEVIDNVQIVRRGGFYTVYLWAIFYYVIKFRNRFDAIVDSENGIPFFSPIYSRKPVFLLIHHIHQEVFRTHLRWPLSLIAQIIEGKLMPIVYRNTNIITISDSSKSEIEKIGLGKKSNIEIIHPGISISKKLHVKKTEFPSMIYLGRLKPYKRIDVALRAFVQISKQYPTAQFFVVGDGEHKEYLKALCKELRISNKVKFFGSVSEKQKQILLKKSWIMIQPSQIEGWGITVIEANAVGTPVVASNVNGLRDSVINGKTGLLAHVGSIKAFVQAIDILFSRPFYLDMLGKDAVIWANNFSWEKSAQSFYRIIFKIISNKDAAMNSLLFAEKGIA